MHRDELLRLPDACDVEPALSEGSVLVDIPGTNSLVITAYEPTHWTVEVADATSSVLIAMKLLGGSAKKH